MSCLNSDIFLEFISRFFLKKSLEVKKKCLPLQSQTKNGVHKHSRFGKYSKFVFEIFQGGRMMSEGVTLW